MDDGIVFWVSNPSPFRRDDFVEVDLSRLGIPKSVDEERLRLLRCYGYGDPVEIAYQIDRIPGEGGPRQVMTFRSEATPEGREDYSLMSAKFSIKLGEMRDASLFKERDDLWVGHYYREPKGSEHTDGFNREWSPERKVDGVKLANGKLEAYISLVPSRGVSSEFDYSGSVTSILVKNETSPQPQNQKAKDLLDFLENPSQCRWGQLTHLAFFPLPWESAMSKKVSLSKMQYEVAWSAQGPVRSVCAIRSEEFELWFKPGPVLTPDELRMRCRLYRVYFLYPGASFYNEEIFVLTDDGRRLNFKPYYQSVIPSTRRAFRRFERLDHVPDYFVIWEHFGICWNYSYAADAHVQRIKSEGDSIRWEHPFVNRLKSSNLFMIENPCFGAVNPFHQVGRYGWSFSLFKPLELYPLGEKYYSVEPD